MATATETDTCDVYWGSHGCHLPRGHEGHCVCDCCECLDHERTGGLRVDEQGEFWCVGKFPYYGPDTKFYGDDVRHRGLPHVRGSYTCPHGVFWGEAGLAVPGTLIAICECCQSQYPAQVGRPCRKCRG